MPKFQPARGTRDFLPAEAIRRQGVIEKIRAVFERFGFDPLVTPAFESWELLSAKGGGGDAIRDEIYAFKDKSERELGLRFDNTVPLARVVANNPQMAKPFKRYAIGPVWRYDRPGAGRYREFWQADVDVVGSSSPAADAEIIACTAAVFAELGIACTIRVNTRKVVEGLVAKAGIVAEKLADVTRSLDKLEKIGEEGVVKELSEKGFAKKQIDAVLVGASARGEAALKELEKASPEGVSELRDILAALEPYGVSAEVDASLVRGLDYYTGMVFEVAVAGSGLSLAGGGRYDKLIQVFGGPATPATGVALGIDRIADLLAEQKLLKAPGTRVRAVVVAVSDSVRAEAVRVAQELRKAGLSVATDVMGRSLGKQLEYANNIGAPFAVVVGEKELKAKKFGLRTLASGKQEELTVAEIAERVR